MPGKSGSCFYCGCIVVHIPSKSGKPTPGHALTKDHIIPRVRGGPEPTCIEEAKVQIVIACLTCNQDKGQLTLDEYRAVLAYRTGKLKDFKFVFPGEKE